MAMYNVYILYRSASHRATYLEYQENIIKKFIFEGGKEREHSASVSDTTRIVRGQYFPLEFPKKSMGAKKIVLKEESVRIHIINATHCPSKSETPVRSKCTLHP